MEFDISKLMQSDQITKKLAQVNELRKKRNPLLASKDDLPKFLKDAFRESPQELNSKNISVSKIYYEILTVVSLNVRCVTLQVTVPG
jgi:hypothetical protein